MSSPELILKRIKNHPVKDDYTKYPRTLEDKAIQGVIYEGEEEICKTIECPDLQNQNRISCIPTGRYKAIIHKSAGLGYNVFFLQSVKNRTYIYLHVANSVFHYQTLKRLLKGCIGVGKDITYFKNQESGKDIPAVTSSKNTFKMLMEKYPEGFYLTIFDET